MEFLSRTEMLFGKENVEKLKNKKVIVFGIGGVGGYVCEALARTGVGKIDLVDNDTVSVSNISSPQGKTYFLVVGSSVAKSISAAVTSEFDKRFKSVDLPAFV